MVKRQTSDDGILPNEPNAQYECLTMDGADDKWIPSACGLCYGDCSILAHRQNGVVVKLEGNPKSPYGSGRLCPKGASGIMTLYDPNRVKVPLKRTNPEKGLGVDPKWVEISWEEALDTLVDRLKEVRDTDPRGLVVQSTTTAVTSTYFLCGCFTHAFGSHNFWVAGGGLHCGNGCHVLNGLMHASWSSVPDFDLCNYAIYFGASKGHSAGHAANANAQKVADARSRGMKLVVVDPMCNFAAAKATEWVPIRVGTDGALALAMANVLLNELGIWDAPYLAKHTNAPYLIGADGHYVREQGTDKPLVWDARAGVARAYDDETAADLALEGEYVVNDAVCRPAFVLIKEHVKKYTPEMASEITTVPAQTIRKLAREFGEEARIGSTIAVDGVVLPYRPVSAIFFRGAQGHKNSAHTVAAIGLLNQIVGAADVPGGTLGFNSVSYGHPDTGRPYYVPSAGPDGLMMVGTWMTSHRPYPPRNAGPPSSMMLGEVFPLANVSGFMVSSDQEELWTKLGLPYRPQLLLNYGANSMMSVGNSGTVAESLKKIPFIVSFDILMTEFTDFADMVLPDTCYLERIDPVPNIPILNLGAGQGNWGWAIRQPVVPAGPKVRNFSSVLLEVIERLDMREDFYYGVSIKLDLKGDAKLDAAKKYTWEEICDHVLRYNFGPERGLDWFSREGVITWPKRVEEVYWRPFLKVRVPVYYEFYQTAGEQMKALVEASGLNLDLSGYKALPDWSPCLSHQVKSPEFDLYGFYYRDVLHNNSFTLENPWLDEAAVNNPYSYHATINAEVGRRKGLKDGDLIWIESPTGRRIKGKVRLSEGMHPEGLGVGACAGHWTPNAPIARGKGIFYNELLEIDYEHSDPVNLGLDLCVKLKISKA